MNVTKILSLFCLLVCGPASPAFAQTDQTSAVVKILTAGQLWGKDFPKALASLPEWDRIGDDVVAIFAKQVVGSVPFKTAAAAQPASEKLSAALKQARPAVEPPLAQLLAGMAGEPAQLSSTVLQVVDDDSFRVALAGPDLQFLAPGLTISRVEETLGPAETVTTLVIQSERDRRPVVLTLHNYADGAIAFAESDWSPTPGLVDRVIINVPIVSAIIFGRKQ